METNFFGPHRLIRAALPGFRTRKTGTIVNISSVAGIDGRPSCGLYAASKFALEGLSPKTLSWKVRTPENHLRLAMTGLSETLARETAPFGIHVLIVEPGVFRTNFLSATALPDKPHTEDYQNVKASIDRFSMLAGHQSGDPTKAAERIVEAVTGQGLAGHLKGQVLRMLLGEDCVERFETKIESMGQDLEKGREIAGTTNF